MAARYDTFVILAETLQWDEAAIDFAPDTRAWPMLDDAENAQVLGLIAGFCIAESAVSGHLGSFQAAASDDSVAACFRAQARDEHRHARFFDRVAAEVAAVPGADTAARQDVLRTLVCPELVALFEERLHLVAAEPGSLNKARAEPDVPALVTEDQLYSPTNARKPDG